MDGPGASFMAPISVEPMQACPSSPLFLVALEKNPNHVVRGKN